MGIRSSDLFNFSLDNLKRRKGRTTLTIIGVVVGVCAIIVMISLGMAQMISIDNQIASMGDLTRINIINFGLLDDGPVLNDDTVTDFSHLEHVVAVTPVDTPRDIETANISVLGGDGERFISSYATLIGVYPNQLAPLGYNMAGGDFLSDQSMTKKEIPVIVGDKILSQFSDSLQNANAQNNNEVSFSDLTSQSDALSNALKYDENGDLINAKNFYFDPLSDDLTLRIVYSTDGDGNEQYKEYTLKVQGVLETDSTEDLGLSQAIIMSTENINKLAKEAKKLMARSNSNGFSTNDMGATTKKKSYSQIVVKADNIKTAEGVEKSIEDMGFSTTSASQTRDEMKQSVLQSQFMLGGLAAVSLFVAALNIANTMTMAIYERTKEIGVMKVLGCRVSSIRAMFLIEAGAIGLIGGIIGSALSIGISALINYLSTIMIGSAIGADSLSGGMMDTVMDGDISIVPVWLVFAALGFSILVGVLSGIAPANRAVKITALEAIRHE